MLRLMPNHGTLRLNDDDTFTLKQILKRHDQFMAFYCYRKIMLISISYNYCSVLAANKCFNETELTS